MSYVGIVGHIWDVWRVRVAVTHTDNSGEEPAPSCECAAVIRIIIHNRIYGVVSHRVWLAREITARIVILSCVGYMRKIWDNLNAVVSQPCFP